MLGFLLSHPLRRSRSGLYRALARNPGRQNQIMSHPVLAAAYAQMGRQQDAEGERVIVAHLWPFLDARMLAAQFGARPYVRRAEKGGFH